MFVQDNVGYHTAPPVKKWLRENEVNCIDWPPQSPDINIMENVWATLRNELFNRRDKIRNSNDVWVETLKIFDTLSLAYIHKLYDRIPQRLESIKKLGGNRISH